MHQKDTCFIQIWMEEGDAIVKEEANSAKAKIIKDKPINKTSAIDKMSQTREGHSVEGGAIMLNQAFITILSSVDIVVNLVTMRQSAGKED